MTDIDKKKAVEASEAVLDEEQLGQVSGGGLGVDLDEEAKQKLRATQIEGDNNSPFLLFPDYFG